MNSVGIKEIQLRELKAKAIKAEALSAAEAATTAAETAKQESVMSKPALKLVKARGAAKAATNRARRTKTTARAPSVTVVRPGSKAAAIADLLRRPEGCTTADVLKATGWPSVSLNQQATAAGLTLRKVKEGRITRYFAE
jgi:hypothetical protein